MGQETSADHNTKCTTILAFLHCSMAEMRRQIRNHGWMVRPNRLLAPVLAGTLHLASVWSATRRSRLYSVGNANIDNFRSRCTRYRVCDAGRAEGLASQPPSPGVQGAGSKHMCVGLPTAIFSGHICQFQNTTTIMQVWCLHLSPPTYFSSPARRMTRRTDRWQARNPERTAGCRRHPVRRQSGDSSLPSWSLS